MLERRNCREEIVMIMLASVGRKDEACILHIKRFTLFQGHYCCRIGTLVCIYLSVYFEYTFCQPLLKLFDQCEDRYGSRNAYGSTSSVPLGVHLRVLPSLREALSMQERPLAWPTRSSGPSRR